MLAYTCVFHVQTCTIIAYTCAFYVWTSRIIAYTCVFHAQACNDHSIHMRILCTGFGILLPNHTVRLHIHTPHTAAIAEIGKKGRKM